MQEMLIKDTTVLKVQCSIKRTTQGSLDEQKLQLIFATTVTVRGQIPTHAVNNR
jgi:hypothetical protein